MTNRLSTELADELRQNTSEAAQYFLDDLQHMRGLLTADKAAAGEVRRMSAILRRLLVERTLAAIATPRIGRVNILAPDLKPTHVACRSAAPEFFLESRAPLFGIELAGFVLNAPPGFPDPTFETFMPLSLETFLKQGVMLFEGKWLSRAEIIKFVANVTSGVHAGAIREDHETALAKARRHISVSMRGDVPNVRLSTSKFLGETPFEYDKNSIDAVLLALLATANHVVKSPDVAALEAQIASETR